MAAFFGSSLQNLPVYSFGVFMLPVAEEFDWSRASTSAALTLFAMLVVPFGPFMGGQIDKRGSRALALPGAIMLGLAFALLSLNNGMLPLWFALWALVGLAALFIKTTVWTTAVSSVFTRGRGLALAFTLSGLGLASSGAPILSRLAIDNFGWRSAYAMIGLGWSAAVLLILYLFFFDAGDRKRRSIDGSRASATSPGGLTLREALRTGSFRMILASTLFLNIIMAGLAVHINPILISQGLTPTHAAAALGIYGFAGTFGKLGSGWLLDRFHGRIIAPIILIVPALAALVLLQPLTIPLALVAVSLVALASGAELQALTYLTTRYVGLRHLGKIYGTFTSIVAACIGIGPVLAGYIFDLTGSYHLLLLGLIPVTLACSFMLTKLPPYPEHATESV